MAKYLVNVVETYRVDTEAEAEEFIAESKNSTKYELKKYSSEYKEAKQKGEVVDSWYRVSLNKVFNSEKEPDLGVSVRYE